MENKKSNKKAEVIKKVNKPNNVPEKVKVAKVNDWGHRMGSQSATIDAMVKRYLAGKKALVVGEIAKELKLSDARVALHLRHLKQEKVIKDYTSKPQGGGKEEL